MSQPRGNTDRLNRQALLLDVRADSGWAPSSDDDDDNDGSRLTWRGVLGVLGLMMVVGAGGLYVFATRPQAVAAVSDSASWISGATESAAGAVSADGGATTADASGNVVESDNIYDARDREDLQRAEQARADAAEASARAADRAAEPQPRASASSNVDDGGPLTF
jgi:hypothetical protein